jgi:thiamine-phosphate pyrophosphorylase
VPPPLSDLRLYLVTDRTRTRGRPLLDVVEQALAGGVDAVQLREKDLPARQLLALAEHLRDLCGQFGARLLINDRLDVALAVGADGVHLPAQSFTPAQARQLLGPGSLVGVSTHTLSEAHAAAAAGADFIVFGPIYDTPSKRAYGPPLGVDALHEACATSRIPVLAIGGIMTTRAAAVRARGAHGIAVVGAVLEAAEPRAAAAQLHRALGLP